MSWKGLVEKNIVPANHSNLIGDLQEVHDEYVPELWEQELRLVAEKYNLRYGN